MMRQQHQRSRRGRRCVLAVVVLLTFGWLLHLTFSTNRNGVDRVKEATAVAPAVDIASTTQTTTTPKAITTPPTSSIDDSGDAATLRKDVGMISSSMAPEQPILLPASIDGLTNNITTKPLGLLHIPKTGGTSLAEAAIRSKLSWGVCLFRATDVAKGGKDVKRLDCAERPSHGEWPKRMKEQTYKEVGTSWHHIPIQYLPLQLVDKPNPYLNTDLFVVLRNPYERAISEVLWKYGKQLRAYNQAAARKRKRKKQPPSEPPKMNAEVLNTRIQEAMKIMVTAEPNTKEYFLHGAHWIPQYDYVYDYDHHDDNASRKPMVHYILHSETMDMELPGLLKAYGLDTKIELHHSNKRNADLDRLGVQNLTESTLELLETVYEKDFILGGYPMISSKAAAAAANKVGAATTEAAKPSL